MKIKIIEPLEDTNESLEQDDALTSIIDWNKAIVKINDDSKKVRINFDETWRNSKTIHFATNNGHLLSFEIDTQWLNEHYKDNPVSMNKSFNWGEQVKFDNFHEPTVIKEVHIEDLDGINHSIYRNNNFFK